MVHYWHRKKKMTRTTALTVILLISLLANLLLAIGYFSEERSMATYKARLYQWKLDDRQRLINLKSAHPTLLNDLQIPPLPTLP
jgi:hypothetical protein